MAAMAYKVSLEQTGGATETQWPEHEPGLY